MVDAKIIADVFSAASDGIHKYWKEKRTYNSSDFEVAMTQAAAFDGVAVLFNRLVEAEAEYNKRLYNTMYQNIAP